MEHNKLIRFIVALAVSSVLMQQISAQAIKKPVTLSGNSENAWRLGIGAEAGIPLGDNINNFSNFALGGSARLQYDLKGPVSLMLTSGYTNFFAKSYSVGSYSVSPKNYGIVPVKAGLKYFAKRKFYFSGEAGAGFETTGIYKSTKLIFSPGIGIADARSNIDVSLRYEHYSGGKTDDFGLVALRLAYGFKL